MAPGQMLNVPRLRAKLTEARLDALILAAPENFVYAAGAPIATLRTLRDRLAFSVLTQAAEAMAVVCTIEESFTRQESWITDVRGYVERKDDPVDALAAALRDKGWHRGRLGYEARFLPVAVFDKLRKALPEATLVPADDVIIGVRAVKTPKEIERIRDAARATERAIADAFAAAHPGDTEKSVNDRIMVNMLASGADSILFSVLGTGVNALHPHAIAGSKRLTAGEAGRVDSGAEFHGYMSDLARSVGIGNVPGHVVDAYKRLRAVERETIAYLQPGRLGSAVFDFCKSAFERHKLAFSMPHIGHGVAVVGGEIHEEPNLHPFNQIALEAGMILNIEPFYFDPDGRFALHIEDAALVTETGSVILSDAVPTEDLFIIR